jgi:hypothetical protein
MLLQNLYIIQKHPCDSLIEFIDHWRNLYSYFDDSKYRLNIDKSEFSAEHLEDLFHWKNGMTLKGSGGKEKSLNEKILKRIDIINHYKKLHVIDLNQFNDDFSDISAVWRIFLLHTIQPNVYPIYDQHIHRTYNYIHNEEWQTINNTISDKKKIEFYYSTYLPFVQNIGTVDLKAMDEAFFAFGQFLNTRNQRYLLEKDFY